MPISSLQLPGTIRGSLLGAVLRPLNSGVSHLTKSQLIKPIMKLVVAITLILPAFVQAASPSSYAGQESRAIKALSPSEQSDLLSGKGMGLAKAAELNGYPGPAHVLELASQLDLSADQFASTQALFASMEHRARELGQKLVAAEQSLDTMFASKQASSARLKRLLATIGDLQSKVRSAHLMAHIEQGRILSAEQNAKYAKLRGYSPGSQEGAGHVHSGVHGGG